MSTMWRTIAEEAWKRGDHDAATFAHGQALRSEACKTVALWCSYCRRPGHTVAKCPVQASHVVSDMAYEGQYW